MSNSLTAPPQVIASWPERNAVNPATKGSTMDYVAGVFSALGIFVVVLRLYTRHFITRALGLDDILIAIGLLLTVALSILLSVGTHKWYLGYHVWDLTYAQIVDHRYGTFVVTYVSVTSTNLIRLSVLLFYKRLSKGVHSELLIASWIGITYIVLSLIVMWIANSLICYPVTAYWNRYDPTWAAGHRFICGNEGLSLPACNVALVVGDLYCTVLPLVMFLRMKLTFRQKVQLSAVFSVGFFACAAGITRVVFLVRSVSQRYDFTWEVYDMWIWVIIESFLGIIAACAPALKVLPGRIAERGFLAGLAPSVPGRSSIPSMANTPVPPRSRNGRDLDLPAWKIDDDDEPFNHQQDDTKSATNIRYSRTNSS